MAAVVQLERVFPARAGMIPICSGGFFGDRRIPRESGDDPIPIIVGPFIPEYSPRERG